MKEKETKEERDNLYTWIEKLEFELLELRILNCIVLLSSASFFS